MLCISPRLEAFRAFQPGNEIMVSMQQRDRQVFESTGMGVLDEGLLSWGEDPTAVRPSICASRDTVWGCSKQLLLTLQHTEVLGTCLMHNQHSVHVC